MPTIQKRLSYRAALKVEGAPIGSRAFQKEEKARAWLRKEKRKAIASGSDPEEIASELRERSSYRVMVRLKGHPEQYATFRLLTDAKRWGQATESAIREGRYFKQAEAKRHTLGDLIDRYAREVLSRKPKKKREDQERHLRWWKEHLGSYALSDVTPALVTEVRSKLAEGTTHYGRKRTPATVNRYLTTLSHAFSVASGEWEWVESNPVRRTRKLKEPRGRIRFLSDEERERLLTACRESHEPRLFLLVLLALSTGGRRGELLGLRWPDIDLGRQVAVLHETKNEQRRALPLTGLALDVLKKHSKVRRLDTDLVFANSEGKATFPRIAWQKALRAAGIEDFRFHDLRHSAASYLAMSGATLAEIAEVLGHKTLAMVKRYSHLTEQHTSQVVARMNEKFISGGA